MGIDEQMIIIRRNDFLAHLTRDDYEMLNIAHNYVIANKSAYIYFDAHSLSKLYFVKEGHVKIGNIDDEGNEMIKEILQPGDVFGQFTLEQGNMRGEFAQAHKSEVILCAFTINDFEKLLNEKPQLAIQYSKKVGQKLRKIENRLLNLLQKDVRTRVLYFFWTLIPVADQNNPGTVSITNYMTHEDIARLTGTSRQTVTTLVNQFEDEGILKMDRNLILIYNVKLLHKEAKVG
jgi:CRP/FNR family transcriptional regulator, cyclic AMP receptor protein